jgi:hypothetical protein
VLIRYALEVDPTSDACAEYAVRLLLEGIGVAGQRCALPADADLVYAVEPPADLPDHALWIRACGASDWDGGAAAIVWSGDLPVVAGNGRERVSAVVDHVGEDIVYSTYAIASGALERRAPKDKWGVPRADEGLLAREGALARPAVAVYCRHLVTALERRRRSPLETVPRWPAGKRYAVVLSHDVDVPFARAPWAFYGRRLRRNIADRNPRAALRGVLQAAKAAAVTRGQMRDAASDANFCFDAWFDLEASLSAASCFYVAVTSSADRAASAYDVNYDFRHPELVSALRRAVDAGWEVGLHASINAYRSPDRLKDERGMLESVLGAYRVQGVRHHYWALDPRHPERTLRLHDGAGLSYDSSFGLNDAPGFRRGMAWPFEPFDSERREAVSMLEVPPTLMDGGIFYRPVTPDEGRRLIEEHIGIVRELGGAAVLDWHLEQLNPARLRGAGTALVAVLAALAADSTVYWATPGQVAQWWRARRDRIQASV